MCDVGDSASGILRHFVDHVNIFDECLPLLHRQRDAFLAGFHILAIAIVLADIHQELPLEFIDRNTLFRPELHKLDVVVFSVVAIRGGSTT